MLSRSWDMILCQKPPWDPAFCPLLERLPEVILYGGVHGDICWVHFITTYNPPISISLSYVRFLQGICFSLRCWWFWECDVQILVSREWVTDFLMYGEVSYNYMPIAANILSSFFSHTDQCHFLTPRIAACISCPTARMWQKWCTRIHAQLHYATWRSFVYPGWVESEFSWVSIPKLRWRYRVCLLIIHEFCLFVFVRKIKSLYKAANSNHSKLS